MAEIGQEDIKEICSLEIKYGLYNERIGGIPLYLLIRREVRANVIRQRGRDVMKIESPVDKVVAVKSALQSSWDLFGLFVSRKRYQTVFYSFPRVDKVNDVYLDKFTDPLIEQCNLDDDYIILDHGRAGVHAKPRLHQSKIVYWDFIHILSVIYTKICYKQFYKRHKAHIDKLFDKIEDAYGMGFDRQKYTKQLQTVYANIRMLQKVMHHIGARQLIGPARHTHFFIAAKQLGLRTMEVQHGITYAETLLYSGYRDPLLTPDAFLAFGDNKPLNVYGIDENKIFNIGWAMQDYLAKLPSKLQFGESDVLVVSDPEVSNAMIEAVHHLSESFPTIIFHFRPHPHEEMTPERRKRLAEHSNVLLQDYHINISQVLMAVKYVVGENSTVIYEALAAGKRVGKLFFKGLNPIYLNEEDRNSFWEIKDNLSFDVFLNGKSEKPNRSIYSPFDKEKFLDLLNTER